MSEPRKKPLWPWSVALLIGLPVLYVASSGPTRMVAFHQSSTGISETGIGFKYFAADEWWLKLYDPLLWVSEQSWGSPLNRYWDWFPLDDTPRLP
jgi:hypothetical protein